jgi:hypothetical protein
MKSLPKQFHKYFWDTDAATIDVESKAAYVITRLLQWGRVEELRWLKNYYGLEALRVVVRRSRELSAKHGKFFSLIYDIPPEEVLCLQMGSLQQPKGAWKH